MSTRDFSWGKGGRRVRLTSYHPRSAERQENPGLNLLGTPWATSACCGMTFTFTLLNQPTNKFNAIHWQSSACYWNLILAASCYFIISLNMCIIIAYTSRLYKWSLSCEISKQKCFVVGFPISITRSIPPPPSTTPRSPNCFIFF